MTASEWGIVIGVATSVLLAFGPWMFMVHAKLAVVASLVARLETKVDKLSDAQQDRLERCVEHEAALGSCAARLDAVESRLDAIKPAPLQNHAPRRKRSQA